MYKIQKSKINEKSRKFALNLQSWTKIARQIRKNYKIQ